MAMKQALRPHAPFRMDQRRAWLRLRCTRTLTITQALTLVWPRSSRGFDLQRGHFCFRGNHCIFCSILAWWRNGWHESTWPPGEFPSISWDIDLEDSNFSTPLKIKKNDSDSSRRVFVEGSEVFFLASTCNCTWLIIVVLFEFNSTMPWKKQKKIPYRGSSRDKQSTFHRCRRVAK